MEYSLLFAIFENLDGLPSRCLEATPQYLKVVGNVFRQAPGFRRAQPASSSATGNSTLLDAIS